MPRRGVRVVVLCEDDEHKRFARYTLLRSKFHPREIRLLPCPQGQGSAEQYVRLRYPDEVRAFRRQASHQKVGLIVLIDADTQTVDAKHAQLDQALRRQQLTMRSSDESIIIFVPRRHIETWLAYLLDHRVDEKEDCKHLVRDIDYRRPAERFVDWYQKPADRPSPLLPSITRAYAELDRMPRKD